VDEIDVTARKLALRLRLLLLADDAYNGFLAPGSVCHESYLIEAEFGVPLNHFYCQHRPDRDVVLWGRPGR